MRYEITLKPAAIKDLDKLRKYDAVTILDAIEKYLISEPCKESKSRIKRLRGKQPSDYRLLVGNFRVFYTIEGNAVFVLRVIHKEETASYYQEG